MLTRVSWMVFRLLRCQLSIDGLWWERAERLDVCTVPVAGGEEWRQRWIPRRWHGIALAVDLGIPFSGHTFGAISDSDVPTCVDRDVHYIYVTYEHFPPN